MARTKLFYKPECAWAGDFIPFYKDERFRLFYLHDWRNAEEYGEGTPWYQVSTSDFVNVHEHGEMLPRGTREEQDLYVYTGSVIEAEGCFHIFYTGHNPHLRNRGRPEQAVMHAVSQDLMTWEKNPDDTFYADTAIYEPNDWRDPFVFWNEETREYWMLLAARTKEGPSRRRGCIALCTSSNLKQWTTCSPFWSPRLYYTHECPDLFRIGNWYYLVYSTFTERHVTHYRMSRTLKGPWIAPENDAFDSRAFYAAKTCSDTKRRYVFGWNPTRELNRDYNKWQWGGSLVVHELVQESDGKLVVRVPESVDRAFTTEIPSTFSPVLGDWEIQDGRLSVKVPDSFGVAVATKMPSCCRIGVDITFTAHTRSCGVMLRVSDDFDKAYYIRLEPEMNRLVFDAWPRSGDIPFMAELERPVKLVPGKNYQLKIFIEHSVCEVYLDNRIAMSTRIYDLIEGKWGFFAQEGEVVFREATIRKRDNR